MSRAEILVDPASKIVYTPVACGECRQTEVGPGRTAFTSAGVVYTHVIA